MMLNKALTKGILVLDSLTLALWAAVLISVVAHV